VRKPRSTTPLGGLVVACAGVLAGAVFAPVTVALVHASPAPARAIGAVEHAATGATSSSIGGLTVRLRISPARVTRDAAVVFSVSIAARHAVGALGYRLSFGDGTSRANIIPLYCRAGPGVPAHASWRFDHRYEKAGLYRVSVIGYVNCAAARATATATVVVT